MRGRLAVAMLLLKEDRNTPAYAGKTVSVINQLLRYGKHPRVCGEDLRKSGVFQQGKETPPRMRGRLAAMTESNRSYRNTPAYAGKTEHDI